MVVLLILPSEMALVPLTVVSKYACDEKGWKLLHMYLEKKLSCTSCAVCGKTFGKGSLIHFIHLLHIQHSVVWLFY